MVFRFLFRVFKWLFFLTLVVLLLQFWLVSKEYIFTEEAVATVARKYVGKSEEITENAPKVRSHNITREQSLCDSHSSWPSTWSIIRIIQYVRISLKQNPHTKRVVPAVDALCYILITYNQLNQSKLTLWLGLKPLFKIILIFHNSIWENEAQ